MLNGFDRPGHISTFLKLAATDGYRPMYRRRVVAS